MLKPAPCRKGSSPRSRRHPPNPFVQRNDNPPCRYPAQPRPLPDLTENRLPPAGKTPGVAATDWNGARTRRQGALPQGIFKFSNGVTFSSSVSVSINGWWHGRCARQIRRRAGFRWGTLMAGLTDGDGTAGRPSPVSGATPETTGRRPVLPQIHRINIHRQCHVVRQRERPDDFGQRLAQFAHRACP